MWLRQHLTFITVNKAVLDYNTPAVQGIVLLRLRLALANVLQRTAAGYDGARYT